MSAQVLINVWLPPGEDKYCEVITVSFDEEELAIAAMQKIAKNPDDLYSYDGMLLAIGSRAMGTVEAGQ